MNRKIVDENVRDPRPLLADLDERDRKHKDTFSRLRFYFYWLEESHCSWLLPDLELYRQHLLTNSHLSTTTARLHLTTIRACYRRFLERDSSGRELWNILVSFMDEDELPEAIEAIRTHMYAAIDPELSRVEVQSSTHEYVRLTVDQVYELLRAPSWNSPTGKRDTAVMALMLATGLRVTEVIALTVDDLRHETSDGLAIRIQSSKPNEQVRFIPYGGMIWVLDLVDIWLEQAKIKEGPVFRPYHVKSGVFRKTRISVRAIETIMTNYPIHLDGKKAAVTPMVLRRSYASRLFEEGVPLNRIQEYLSVGAGAVFDYIGETTRKQARTEIPNLYSINSEAIEEARRTGTIGRSSSQS